MRWEAKDIAAASDTGADADAVVETNWKHPSPESLKYEFHIALSRKQSVCSISQTISDIINFIGKLKDIHTGIIAT